MGAISDSQFNPGDVMSLRILTKVADSGGHSPPLGTKANRPQTNKTEAATWIDVRKILFIDYLQME
jgi:hypothetical protein